MIDRGVLKRALGALLLCAMQAHASSMNLDIPTLSLDRALERLAEVTGLQVLYPSALTEGLSSAPLRGQYTLDEALQRLLEGTGLVFRHTAEGAVLIEREDADSPRGVGVLRVPGTQIVRRGVNGSRDALATEGSGRYAAPGATVGAPFAQPLKEIPRAVTVLGQPQIRDQGIVEVSDAVQRLPGVAVVGHPGSSLNALSRGQTVSYFQIDGGAPLPFPIQRITGDLSPYDRIELLRGADGIGNAFAPPSGILNLARKRPLDRPQLVVEARGGSWDHYRGMLDATGPLGWDSRVRGRAVISGVDRGAFYDRGFEQRASYYGIAEADLTPTTLLGIGAHYSDQRGAPWEISGLPVYDNGAPVGLPRTTSFIPPWNFEQVRTRQAFADLEQTLGRDWKLRLTAMRYSEDRDALQSLFGGTVDPETGDGLNFFSLFRLNEDRHDLADLGLDGRFRWRGREQIVSLNLHYASYEQLESYLFTDFTQDPVFINVFDYDPYEWPRVSLDTELVDEPFVDRLRRYGGSITLTLNPWRSLGLISAWRWSERANRSSLVPTDDEKARDRRRGLSYLALTWALDERWNLYTSWADGYTSNDELLTESGRHPEPTVGNNYEAGVKFATRDGGLNALLAVYRTERRNFPVELESSDGFRCCFVNSENVRERLHGVEAEIAGTLLPGWQVVAGYAFGSNRFEGESFFTGGLVETVVDTLTPRHSYRIWTTWQAPGGTWQPLRLGAGISGRSSALRSGVTLDPNYGPIRARGYAVVDTLIGWQPSYAYWEAALHVRNLFDRHYYVATDPLGRPQNFYGEPRSLLLSLRVGF